MDNFGEKYQKGEYEDIDWEIVKKARLFEGLEASEIEWSLNCLAPVVRQYKRGEVIFHEGDEAGFVGIILSGEIQTQKVDFEGNVNIISRLFAPNMLAAVAAYSSSKRLPFDIVAGFDTKVLCLNRGGILKSCGRACEFHAKIIGNMLSIIADKNVELSQKIDILTKRSLREKILAYLHFNAKRAKSKSFTINLSRRQMAEYLSVNRSALSRELASLQSQKIIDFSGNHFKLN